MHLSILHRPCILYEPKTSLFSYENLKKIVATRATLLLKYVPNRVSDGALPQTPLCELSASQTP